MFYTKKQKTSGNLTLAMRMAFIAKLLSQKIIINILKIYAMVSPYLNRYRNAEFLQYMKDVVKLVNLQDVDTLKLTVPRDVLHNTTLEIEEVYLQVQGSTITKEIIALDTRRDKAFMGIKTVAAGFAYHYKEELVNASQRIINTIQVYGTDITRKSYQEETAIVDSFLDDLTTNPILIAAVSTLNLQEMVTELQTANTTFSQKYIERVGETAANTNASITELRVKTTEAYRSLVGHIEAHNTLTDIEVYRNLLSELDVLTKQYNLVISNRGVLNNTPVVTENVTANSSEKK